MGNLQFIPSSTAVNFRAYCDAMNAALKMGLVELDQLCKEGGLNDLYAMQNQIMADAVLKSGEEQASAKRLEGIGQMVSAGLSVATTAGFEARARGLESQKGTSIVKTGIKEVPKDAVDANGVTVANNNNAGKAEPALPIDNVAKTKAEKKAKNKAKEEEEETVKKADKEKDSFYAQATQARQMGHTLSQAVSGLSSGTFGIAAAGHQLAAAHADELRTLADGGVNQANRAIQLLSTLLQLIKEQKDLAIQTQSAIAQATHA